MSEETAQKLKEAEAHLSSMEDEATARKNELLIAVAERLPGHARQLAKRTGQSEPDVTRALGTEGIKELRSQLEDLASELAADVAGAVSEVTWPKPSHFSSVKPNDVRKSLFEFMYGQKMTKFAKVFKDHGFNTYDGNNRGHQSLVLPQSFFSEDEIAEEIKALGTVLMAVTKAEMAVEAAKKADDLAAVDDLWGD
ncbi:hypothetical protein GU243_23915 (plasmid) [Pseudarthrobacter psychrotolerans]|uniref:Uncharacterized protein n=1 Tax=Pseudarthrobacter psychrotolerans TaxID=2697569 RepID=A0A6P1NU46_9MICC|nr:hypothetical protein [Pseudarthrobacter psychrotolerans]QHK22613.1 hypothetical protein GU243_23915 [Pseudarthrobacter psychrotolerans]